MERIFTKEKTDILREWISETETKGIKIDESTKRFYPNNSLASHVLGFVGTDNQGLYGIEKTYEDVLEGCRELLNYLLN